MGHIQVSILYPHIFASASYHEISRLYLAVLIVVLSSTGKCDPYPYHDDRVSTQNDVTTQTTINPSFWSVADRKNSQNTQIIGESTSESFTSSPLVHNKNENTEYPLNISQDQHQY